MAHNIGASCPLSPTLLLDLRLEAGYTFAPFGFYEVTKKQVKYLYIY